MSAPKMHADEVATDVALVQRLLDSQFPQWAGLTITPVESGGTDHAIYRVGDDLVARLPRIHWAIEQAEKERVWLPRLAPHLPLAIPEPVGWGEPGAGYPYNWSVCTWLHGENATVDRIVDLDRFVDDLVAFIRALRAIDTTDAPRTQRSGPLADRDTATRAALARLDGWIDVDGARRVWDEALAAPVWDAPLVWMHGDLTSNNLIARDGRLYGVIDFGSLGLGDPACD